VFLAYEALADLPMKQATVTTPLATMQAPTVDGSAVVFVSILRAGNGMLDGMLEALPTARAGHIGLYRDPQTHRPVEYYCKLPQDTALCNIIVVDPMLATGHSAIAAISKLKVLKPPAIKFICLLAAPEGITTFSAAHPDVPIITASIDQKLNEHCYIVPGLGDAGDRLYGTK